MALTRAYGGADRLAIAPAPRAGATPRRMSRHTHERARMVERDLVARGLQDPAVLAAMREVPRERFVDPGMEDAAYQDSPLPIGERQTISQPYIVALMAEAARLRPDDSVLEVGTGSGYAAAVFAQIAAQVRTIERHATLAHGAERRFAELGYGNIHVRVGDGSRGWPEHAPYDAIIVAAGAPEPPRALREQLAVGGRLVLPVGKLHFGQRLVRITRTGPDDFAHQDLGGVSFVPLVGEQGWTRAAGGDADAASPPTIAATTDSSDDHAGDAGKAITGTATQATPAGDDRR